MQSFSFSEFKIYIDERPVRELEQKKKIQSVLIVTIAIIITLSNSYVVQAAGINTSRIDAKGKSITNLALKISKWSVMIMGGWEGSKAIMAGNAKGVPQIVLKYVLAYASLMALPWLMGEVDGLFK